MISHDKSIEACDAGRSSCARRLLILLFILVFGCSGSFFTGFASVPVELSAEDEANLVEVANALDATIKETKGELEQVQSRYEWVVDTFGNHKYPKILDLINRIDRAGFRSKIQGTLDALSAIDDGIGEVVAARGQYDQAKAFMDRYRPDRNNPMRSLEQIGNALEDLNRLVEKVDPSGGVVSKPIREMIAFYQQATTAYANALKRVEEKIQKRAGNGIGEGIPGTSDKHQFFLQQFPGVTAYRYNKIKYNRPGSSSEEAEFWEDQGGRAFVWRDGHWREIRCGVAGLQTVFDGLYEAFGARPTLDTLLAGCDVDAVTLAAAEQTAREQYDTLYGDGECVMDILSLRRIKLAKLPLKTFIATYIFDPIYTKRIDRIVNQLENAILVKGRVVAAGGSGAGLAGIPVSVHSAAGINMATSESGGWFSLVLDLSPAGGHRKATVRVSSDDFMDYEKDWPLDGPCNQWTSIRLEKSVITMPELMGKTASQATDMLEQLGLVPERVSAGAPPDADGENLVIWQSVATGITLSPGTRVSFRSYDAYAAPASSGVDVAVPVDGGPVTMEPPVDASEVDTSTTSEPLAGYDGGLFVSGPSVLIAGESSMFTAVDGQGKAYPASGAITWFSTMEDNLVLERSGNPVRGSVSKAGKATILMKFDGGSAWFDLTIRARVPDVTGRSRTQAIGAIEQLNLLASVSGDDTGENEETYVVQSQNPIAGTVVDAGTRVLLELAPGEAGESASEDSLFSMAGGEKVDESDSIFSMAGGEKVDDREPPSIVETGISLLGEELENRQTPSAAERPVQPPQDAGDPALQMVYPQQHVENRYGFHDRYWHVRVKLKHVPPETVVEKRAYLVIRLDDRTHYAHYYNPSTQMFECVLYATARTGTRRLHISCEGLSRVPDLKMNVEVGEIPADYKSRIVKGCDLTKVSEARQRYETARRENRNDPDRIMRAHLYYARSLQNAAAAHAELNRYEAAVNMISEAREIFESYRLTIAAQQKDYFRLLGCYSDIMREVLQDHQAYLEMIRHEIGVLMQLQQTVYTDNHRMISQIVMQHAEQLLTFGVDKSAVAPFVQIGLNNMTEQERTNFVTYNGREKEYNSTYSGSMQHYFNCAELFVKRK